MEGPTNRDNALQTSATPDSAWYQVELAAEFKRHLERLTGWANASPQWPAFQSAQRQLIACQPQLRVVQANLTRVLVVGLVGGTGVGKSTLINALVGQEVCRTGERRPTTRHPVVLCHSDIDPTFLGLADAQPELRTLNLPILEDMILVDCPDPDTQEPGHPENRNRDVLRQVLPQCDVILYVTTTQKYRDFVVQEEVLRHAAGRSLLFVQTHAASDHDIRDDWEQELKRRGFTVPPIFFLDSHAASTGHPGDANLVKDFERLKEHLHVDLAKIGRHAIKRANALDHLLHVVVNMRQTIQASLVKIDALRGAVAEQHRQIYIQLAERVRQRLVSCRHLWQVRLSEQLAATWGSGLFGSLLRVFDNLGMWLELLLFARARTPIQLLVAGGVKAGRLVSRMARTGGDANLQMAASDLGVTDADLGRARSILTGFALEAELDLDVRGEEASRGEQGLDEQLRSVTLALGSQLGTAVTDAVERQVSQRVRRSTRFLVELACGSLVGYVLFLLGRNFFYETPWLGKPLLGAGFLVQALFWIMAGAMTLRWGLLRWLVRGLDQTVASFIKGLSAESVLRDLFAEFHEAGLEIQQHAKLLAAIEADVRQLRGRFGRVDEVPVGRLDACLSHCTETPFQGAEQDAGQVL